MSEPNNSAPASREAAPTNTPAGNDRTRIAMQTLLSAFIAMLALSPVAYVLHRNMPPRVATVDLQMLIEEEQKRMLDVGSQDSDVTDEQRAMVEKLTVDFAKKLSGTVDELSKECNCVIVNKAALLGGKAIDYTDHVRARITR